MKQAGLSPRRPSIQTIAQFAKRPIHNLTRKVWKVGSPSANPYATHVPVLVACALLFKPSRILELGSGFHSTPLFLDRRIFPDVVQVRSLENDADWFDKLEHLNDPRLDRVLVKGSMCDAVEVIDCSGFDLIFVDDSTSAAYRRQTLDALRRKILGSQLVVVHDFDLWPIRFGVTSYPQHQGMLGLTPQCGVAWKQRGVNRKLLGKADEILRKFRSDIREDDALLWRDKFMESMPVE